MRFPAGRLPLVALCACLSLPAVPGAQQAARGAQPAGTDGRRSLPARSQQPSPDGIALLLQKIEQAVRSGDSSAYDGLIAPGADNAENTTFARSVIRPGVTRAVVRERDRAPLKGVAAGEGYSLAVDVLCEYGARARLSTWKLDVVRGRAPASGEGGPWAIKAHDQISSFADLYNLALGRREYAAKNLVITAEGLELRLPEGGVFFAQTEFGPAALVLVGRGRMVFQPAPATEREQVRIFAGADRIDADFTAAFVRVSPFALQSHVAAGTLVERAADPEQAKIAADVFRQDNGKSYAVNLGDLATSGTWSLMPGTADFLVETHTKRFGVLTYTRAAHEAEDVNVFDRARGRNISLYASPEKLAQRGFFYDDADGQDYEVLHYDIDASMDPPRQAMTGVARLTVKIRSESASTLTLKLAESLTIDSISSREFGRVVFIRVVNQNTFLVSLPKSVSKGTILGFTVAYHGRIVPQMIDRESVSVEPQRQEQQARQEQEQDALDIPLEPSYLYSNRSYWYPQDETSSFATATIRAKVPAGYACVASGDPDTATADAMARLPLAGTEFVFRALQPVRYLSILVTRLLPVRSQLVDGIETPDVAGPLPARSGVFYSDVDLRSFAAPRMRARTVAMTDRAADIVRFYASLIGDCPYPTLTLALVERELPAGHSPGYLAVVSQPVFTTRYQWRSDPASFPQFPEFFLAHEIAHQWWGQAVGWKNYHEQWLSEGLAQYFAALYAERLHGKEVFNDILGKMQEWAVKKSAEGPVYLGYRVGHLKRDPQLFRAIVYNKSAVVLHMLRRLVGDDAFMRGLRRFYREWRFRNAGSDDLRLAFEAESHRPLERFFERWIYDSSLPRLRFSSRTETEPSSGRAMVVLRFEQSGPLFDVPVTVTLDYADRPAVDVVVAVTDPVTETRVPLEGKLRGVGVNRDRAAVAKIDK